MNIPVLVVDDEYKSFRPRLDSIGNESGFAYTYIGAFSVEEILQKVSNIRDCGVLLLDICGPDGADSGIKVFKELGELEEWRLLQNRVQIVFFSADPTAKKEYEVARNRRSDVDGYVAKESVIRGAQEGLSVLRKAYQRALRYKGFGIFHDQEWVHKIREEHGLLSSPNTSSMKSVWEKVLMAGMCHEPVLIQGETGTGKELVAKAIYEVTRKAALGEATKSVENRRKILGQKKWIAYNIGSAPTEGNIQYTELFGAYPESASSISKYRKGIFEQATVYDEQGREPSGGTVFLDEIGDAAPIIQVSLLRVLQEKEVLPLGAFDGNDGKQKKVEFRLIAASHVDLPARVRDKDSGFRADLYYRLNTISIQLPPLRERKDDIPILVYHFLEELNRDYGREVSISDGNADKLFDRLKRYD